MGTSGAMRPWDSASHLSPRCWTNSGTSLRVATSVTNGKNSRYVQLLCGASWLDLTAACTPRVRFHPDDQRHEHDVNAIFTQMSNGKNSMYVQLFEASPDRGRGWLHRFRPESFSCAVLLPRASVLLPVGFLFSSFCPGSPGWV